MMGASWDGGRRCSRIERVRHGGRKPRAMEGVGTETCEGRGGTEKEDGGG